MDIERFFEASTPQTCSGIKRMDMDIIYDISDKQTKRKVFLELLSATRAWFVSKIHHIPEIRASTRTVGNPIQINIILWNYQSEKSDWIQTYDVLASLTKVREKYFRFFIFVRNIISDVHVHSFDPWASLGSASFGKPLIIDIFLSKSMVFLAKSWFSLSELR